MVLGTDVSNYVKRSRRGHKRTQIGCERSISVLPGAKQILIPADVGLLSALRQRRYARRLSGQYSPRCCGKI